MVQVGRSSVEEQHHRILLVELVVGKIVVVVVVVGIPELELRKNFEADRMSHLVGELHRSLKDLVNCPVELHTEKLDCWLLEHHSYCLDRILVPEVPLWSQPPKQVRIIERPM